MEHLSDKVAVITGGASGIGFATALRLASRGVRLVLADIEESALDRAATELAATGTAVEGVVCDVGDLKAVQHLADTAFEKMGAVHIVFHNAGVAVGGPIAEMQHSDWEWTMRVNLWGPIHGVEAFTQRMIAQGQGGHMLFTASFAGLVPNVGLGPYCVSKYGVVALAEVLRRELRAHDIGVSVLCPMRVATNIGHSERNRPDELGGPEASPPVLDQGEDNQNLAGRVLDVDDVAAQVVDAVVANRLYILPHEESRTPIRRRFERIDQTFEERREG
ncbi:MAG: SDR family NAD(P)-dependent oxidoreductase [Desulfurellaceae bacterium]|nr:SDR family NAD(P)-dependent oxidoreductase [Desulfurellaceae bacterium]